MKWLFLMDPLESIHYEKDTTYKLMCGAHKQGFPVYYLPKGGLILENQKVWFRAQHVTPNDDPKKLFDLHSWDYFSEEEVSVVFIRTDPPFDNDYLMHTWLLDRLPDTIPVINNPSAVRTVNEKIWATQFYDLMPQTVVTRHKDIALRFIQTHGDCVIKPTDGFGGASVFKVNPKDPNTRVIIETMTKNESQEVIVQKFIPEAVLGDKRILLLNGKILGAVLRVHSEQDHRNNFLSGGKPCATEITTRDHEIVARLKPHLQALGLYFVGIDIMGDYLIEVNVTSPTCLQEMNRLYNEQLEDQVISFVKTLIETNQS